MYAMSKILTQPGNKVMPTLEMARRIEAKDPYTAGHTWRVANFGQILAAALDYPPDKIEAIIWAGTLHDIGKIAVPDEILCKPGRLTDEEFNVLKRHPVDGYNLLNDMPEFANVLDVVLMHHEAFDGSGYPYGLVGEEIPNEARLFSIVDAFDAMTSTRCYRPAMPGDNAIYEIWRNRGRQFDPEIAEAFIRLYRDGLLDHIVGHSDFGVAVGQCERCGPVIEMDNSQNLDEEVICPVCHAHYAIRIEKDGNFKLTCLD